MTRVRLMKPIPSTLAWAAVAVLSGLPTFAQSSIPAMDRAVTIPQQAGSGLPDGPSSSPSHAQAVSERPPISAENAPKAQVTVLEDTLIRVMTNEPVSSRQSKDGAQVSFTVSEDVVVDNVPVIPRGATIHGEVVKSKKAGVLTGSPELTLKLVSLNLGGRNYPLYTYQFKAQGTSKTKPTETKVKGGAVVGAIVGGVFSGSAKGGSTAVSRAAGMATGAVVGAGVGTMASAATPGPVLTIPAEAQIDFYLASPVSVAPVGAQEAARLAQGLHPGGPTLYVRGEIP